MHMPYHFLSKTFSFFPSALRVIPFGGGEPLLYPHFIAQFYKGHSAIIDQYKFMPGDIENL
jgi:hypothetical protein